MRPRLIKNLRRSLIGLIALVLLAIAVNYAHIWYQRARSVQKAAQILSSEVARSFNRIEYSEYQKGVLRFRISARRVLESRQGKSFLEGIEAYDFNPDGSLHNEIRSRKAEYDRESKVADFSGDVRLFLGTSIELRTESLHYDLHTNIGATEDEVRFHSKMASGSREASILIKTRRD
jgi:LPS export ABC transporter protein LptC